MIWNHLNNIVLPFVNSHQPGITWNILVLNIGRLITVARKTTHHREKEHIKSRKVRKNLTGFGSQN